MIEAGYFAGDGSEAIFDATRYAAFDPRWFDRDFYRDSGALLHSATGRGGVWMLDRGDETWVLRHYHRGGFVARLVYDHYLWTGRDRTRSFREWRLLAQVAAAGLPAPQPIAARVVRLGPIYQADLVTRLIDGVRPLSRFLREGEIASDRWGRIGAMIRVFHRAGVDHPDLTAHNILLGEGPDVYLVDFDNAQIRAPGRWQRAGLARFERSLRKVALETGTQFDEPGWRLVQDAYAGS